MINIAFHSNQLSLRGTEVALYDYAYYNQTLLNNKSIIITKHPSISPYSHSKAIEKFEKQFSVIYYNDISEIDTILKNNNIDILYATKSGRFDGIISNKIKTVIHAVFKDYEPHGNVYAFISEWLGNLYGQPSVPYMVQLPDINENLRKELNIPEDAIVFGRHGGAETFDINFVHEAIKKIAKERNDIYFLFMYTNRFSDDSYHNIIYLDGTSNLNEKTKFINTCDAMVHARVQGETFGLAVAEFSIKNKPVITYNLSDELAHVDMLESTGLYYSNEIEFLNIIQNFKKSNQIIKNKYNDCTPENVMNIFKKIFID